MSPSARDTADAPERAASGSLSDTHTGSRLHGLAAILVVAAATGAIVSTYGVFSHTVDEPAHLAAGIEWLAAGTYNLDREHPPLARIAIGLGPYLSGQRPAGGENMWAAGRRLLYSSGRYSETLGLARLGNLAFYFLASVVVWRWARCIFGAGPALCAVSLFATLPPVLAHSGLATTDMAVAATLASALLAFASWLGSPTRRRGLVLGVATGLALLSKFSSLLFLPAAGLALLVWRFACGVDSLGQAAWKERRKAIFLPIMVTLGVVWAAYRFSFGTLADATAASGRDPAAIERHLAGAGGLAALARAAYYSVPVPAPELVWGIDYVRRHNSRGHQTYFLGRLGHRGWWYFFPVALAVKTPVAFLALTALGIGRLALGGVRGADWRRLAPAAAAAAVLLVGAFSNINIGVRHVLPVYPLLAVIAGFGTHSLWRSSRRGALVAATLVAWQVSAAAAAHPDHLAYFNELAGGRPERILIDSDLDWGQDLLRLEVLLRELRVPSVWIGCFSSADLTRHDLPPYQLLLPAPKGHRPKGWIAISEWVLKGVALPDPDHFDWLGAYQPVARAGRSIRLYYIPEARSPPSLGRAPPPTEGDANTRGRGRGELVTPLDPRVRGW